MRKTSPAPPSRSTGVLETRPFAEGSERDDVGLSTYTSAHHHLRNEGKIRYHVQALANPDLAWLPAAGELVAERYRIRSVLGAGGMGAVLEAVHEQLGTPIALKLLRPSLDDEESVERFFREAQATSRIQNEHVVKVWDVGRTREGIPFLAMEKLEGEDLGQRLAAAPLPLTLAVDCVLQAAEGLKQAHEVGIIHRDIKPSNLWLAIRSDGTPSIKVLDFGISKIAIGDPAGSTGLTQTHAVFGSPQYMSPEQIRSSKRVDAKTDVWSLGVVLFELLTQALPFDGESAAAVLASVAADPPIPLRQLRPELPAEIEQAIVDCLQKSPEARSSLEQLANRLAPFASPVGAIAAARVAGATRHVIVSRPPISMTNETERAAALTDRNLGSATDVHRDRSRMRKLGVLGVVAAVAMVTTALVVGLRMGALHAVAIPTTAPPAASVTSSPIPSDSSVLPSTVMDATAPVQSSAVGSAAPVPTGRPPGRPKPKPDAPREAVVVVAPPPMSESTSVPPATKPAPDPMSNEITQQRK